MGEQFNHMMASVNGINIHYVIQGHGNLSYYCMAGRNFGTFGESRSQYFLSTFRLSFQTCEDSDIRTSHFLDTIPALLVQIYMNWSEI